MKGTMGEECGMGELGRRGRERGRRKRKKIEKGKISLDGCCMDDEGERSVVHG